MRSPQYEYALKKQGLTFTYLESERLENIDVARSLRNQARMKQPIIKELVASYEEVYRAVQIGEETPFPPLVVYRPGKHKDCKLVAVDGNQRITAATQAGRKVHDMYLVDITDSLVIDRVSWIFNNLINGQRLSLEESIEHAVSFIEKHGVSIAQAAKEWGLKTATLSKRLQAQKISEVLKRNKADKASLLPPERLTEISSLLKVGEDVLTKAATLVREAGLNSEQTVELVAIVNRAPTVAEKLKAIDAIANSEAIKTRRAETKGGEIKPHRVEPRDNLAMYVRKGNGLFDRFSDRAALKPRAVDWKSQREAAKDLVEHLALLFGLGAIHRDIITGDHSEGNGTTSNVPIVQQETSSNG